MKKNKKIKVASKKSKKKDISIKTTKKTKSISVSPEVILASKNAKYYGFQRLPDIEVEKADLISAKKFVESHLKTLHPFFSKNEVFGGFLEEKIAIMRGFFEKKYQSLSMPISGFYEGPLKGNPHLKKTEKEETFNLEIIGSGKSISDATIIETACVILKERYPDESLSVEINSIGDKESFSKFVKDLTNFVSKTKGGLEKSCQALVKKDPLNLFKCNHTRCADFQEEAPKPMNYLSEASRNHFKEVLEYLESLHINYFINHKLIGARSYCSDTVFEIKGQKKNEVSILAIGERYNSLARRVFGKKEIPAIGVAILIHPHFVKRKVIEEKTKKAKFFYVQIGFEAKLKSLTCIEALRKEKIPVEQSLSRDKLSVQLQLAEKMNIPYVIIMGQKEAMEDSVVVRNMQTMSQNTVNTKDLPKYLKKLK